MKNIVQETTQKIMTDFQQAEALWLDSVVRPLIPKFIVSYKEKIGKGRQGLVKRLQHFLLDYIFITRVLKIEVNRNQNTEFLGGKGFRPGVTKTRLNSITVRVLKKGKEIAKQDFSINIIIQ